METFSIIPADARFPWFAVIGGVLLVITVGVSALLWSSFNASRTATFEVSPAGLTIKGEWRPKVIPADRIDAAAARAVDLDSDPPLRPAWRTMGTAIPGYSSGWFRLKNGEKALLYVTDRHRVAYVPTRDGYSILLSVEDPEALVASLKKNLAPGSGLNP